MLFQHGQPETDKRSLQKFGKENLTKPLYFISFPPSDSFVHTSAATALACAGRAQY